MHRLSQARHQGSVLRRRFLGGREERQDDGGRGAPAQGSAEASRWQLYPGAALQLRYDEVRRRPVAGNAVKVNWAQDARSSAIRCGTSDTLPVAEAMQLQGIYTSDGNGN